MRGTLVDMHPQRYDVPLEQHVSTNIQTLMKRSKKRPHTKEVSCADVSATAGDPDRTSVLGRENGESVIMVA